MGMFSGFDISSLVNKAIQAASMAALGPAGGILQAQLFQAIGSEILESVIQSVGEELGLPQSVIDLAQSAALSAIGDHAGSLENAKEAWEGILNELNPFERSHICREMDAGISDIKDIWMNNMNQANRTQEDTSEVKEANSKNKNFFMIIAEQLGEMLGDKAFEMMNSLDRLEHAGNRGSKAAKARDFGRAQSDFSANSQMYSMASQLVNSSLKAIGESMSTLARKQ